VLDEEELDDEWREDGDEEELGDEELDEEWLEDEGDEALVDEELRGLDEE
jgi:hypothetical protein